MGLEFLRCVETSLVLIQRTPLVYPVVYEFYRRALVRRFPLATFFEVEDARRSSVVYSVFHCSQDPAKWRARFPYSNQHRISPSTRTQVSRAASLCGLLVPVKAGVRLQRTRDLPEEA